MRSFLTWFALLTSMLISFAAHADLLNRIHLEDTIRQRVEDVFHLYDDKAKVLIRFDYKALEGFLPGTNVESKTASPDRIETGDVTRLYVEVYSELDNVPAEAKTVVMHVIPFEASKVSVEYKKLRPQFPKEMPRALDSQSLATIAQDSVSSLGKWVGLIFLLAIASVVGYGSYSNTVKMREFKEQIGVLTKALSEVSFGGGAAMMPTQEKQAQTISVKTGDDKIFEKFPKEALLEIFADCYWCSEDRYAAWLWKQVSSEQKSTLLSSFAWMKDYSFSFLETTPLEKNEHDHPYYLNPSHLRETSQEDLAKMVAQTPAAWRRLSPLRQQSLNLSLTEKLKALNTTENIQQNLNFPKSSPRKLEVSTHWGRISESDEAALFENPEMIPAPMQGSVATLVWLAHKDATTIKAALEKYDARSLAAAWVGPQEVLAKLEQNLPEKKAKLLQTYRGKVAPSRDSAAYQALVKEGFSRAS